MAMHHDHYDPGTGDSAAAAGITAGMMMAIFGMIAAAVIIFALLVWTPWNDGGSSTNNITNNPVPSQSQPNNSGGNNSGGGTNSQPGGSNSGGTNSGGSSSGGSSSGGSSTNPTR